MRSFPVLRRGLGFVREGNFFGGSNVREGMDRPRAARLEALIHVVRGQRVMLDSDLALIYGVSTARLNQQVGRNIRRFPADFMFRLSHDEHRSLMLQIATSKRGRGGRRKRPLVFTQEGVAMLSCVLRSGRATAANVAIMRAFVRYREALSLNRDLAIKFRALEGRVDRHDVKIGALLDAIRGIIEGPPKTPRGIGFKP